MKWLVAVVLLGVLVIIAGPPWEGPLQLLFGWRAGIDPGGLGGSEVVPWEREVYGDDVRIGAVKTMAWGVVLLWVVAALCPRPAWWKRYREKGKRYRSSSQNWQDGL